MTPSIPFATRTFAEFLIDCEEDRVLRAVLVGMLRDAHHQRGAWAPNIRQGRETFPLLARTW